MIRASRHAVGTNPRKLFGAKVLGGIEGVVRCGGERGCGANCRGTPGKVVIEDFAGVVSGDQGRRLAVEDV